MGSGEERADWTGARKLSWQNLNTHTQTRKYKYTPPNHNTLGLQLLIDKMSEDSKENAQSSFPEPKVMSLNMFYLTISPKIKSC